MGENLVPLVSLRRLTGLTSACTRQGRQHESWFRIALVAARPS